MSIDESVINADLQDRMRDVGPRADSAITLTWQRFLEHARRPLDFGEAFDDDIVSFAANRTSNGGVPCGAPATDRCGPGGVTISSS
jgi:hypothetical protein